MSNDIFDIIGRRFDRIFTDVETMWTQAFGNEDQMSDFRSPGFFRSPGYQVEKARTQTTIVVEVPGLAPEDIRVELSDSILTVSAKSYRTLRFRVDPRLNVSNITATVQPGLLTVVAKANEQSPLLRGSVPVSWG